MRKLMKVLGNVVVLLLAVIIVAGSAVARINLKDTSQLSAKADASKASKFFLRASEKLNWVHIEEDNDWFFFKTGTASIFGATENVVLLPFANGWVLVDDDEPKVEAPKDA